MPRRCYESNAPRCILYCERWQSNARRGFLNAVSTIAWRCRGANVLRVLALICARTQSKMTTQSALGINIHRVSQSSQAKIALEGPHGDVETLWANVVGPHLYELDNLPWYAYGVSAGDLVEARPDQTG